MASLADQLKAVKLSKSDEPMKDFSSPKTAGFMRDEEITQYQEHVLEVNTEKWLHILQEETFPTEYCPLHLNEAQMVLSVYERLYKNLDAPSIARLDWREKLSHAESELVQKIEQRLQKVMDKFFKKDSDFVFVKTSSRSAKDAPMAQSRFKDLYQDFLTQEPEDTRSSENTQITCLLKAAFYGMRVRQASEVMDMTMRSERIFQDILLALQFKDKFCENFVVRTFVDIDVDMEFRGFVFHGNLVALSQYNYLIYSERLCKLKDALSDRIEAFYKNSIRPKLQASKFEENFIIDFAIGSKDDKVWVIEINPFLITTDAALFSWQHERHLLEGRQGQGLEFRVTMRPRPGAKTMLPHSIKMLLS
ncbi:uncharacterized protein [Littorina saxatilis]|uniref:Cell division cycle protein 123 homolog n=1 Tax=Littorina saxatilis TaxID=31220 RepID=A0AAN9BPJ0_9CAEN